MSAALEETKALDDLKTTVHALKEAVEGFREDAVDRETVENIVVDLLAKQKDAAANGAGRRSIEPADVESAIDAIGKTGLERLHAIHTTPAAALAPVIKRSTEEIEHFQRTGDQLLLVSAILDRDERNRLDPRATTFYAEHYVPALRAAMDTGTAAEGQEFVPRELSPNLIKRVNLQLKVAALFQSMQMPTQPWDMPGASVSRLKLALGAEATADTGQTTVPKRTPGTRKATFDAKKFWGAGLVSKEAEEDSIIAMLPFLESELVDYMGYDIENTIINGDTAAGLDTQGGFYAADDPLRNWVGLRKSALAAAKTDFANAKLTASGLRSNRKAMGKFGVNPGQLAHLLSINEYIDILDDTSVLTLEKYGPQATILTGELGSLDSIPLIVSEAVRIDENASGVVDGVTTNRTEAITVYRPGFAIGERRGLTVEILRELYSEYDQDLVKVSVRRAFTPLQPIATEKTVARLYNVKT